MASIAALVALVSCEQMEDLGLPSIKIDGESTMTFDVAGGEQQVTITATRDWMAEYDADWIMLSPESGKASADAQTVTVTAKANTGSDRSAEIKFTIGMAFKTVTVTQSGEKGAVATGDGTEASPYSAAKANEVASALGAEEKKTGVYVQGIVKEIKELSAQYGNATYWIVDEGGETTFYVYRGKYLGNTSFKSEDQLKVGDKVVVYGDLMNYMGDSPQLGQGNYIVNLNGEVADTPKPDASAIYYNDFDKTTAQKDGNNWPELDQFDGWKNAVGTGAEGVTYDWANASARATAGNNNIWLPMKNGGYFAVQGIALNGTADLKLSFNTICGSPGQYKKEFKSEMLKVYVSSDNVKWVELAYEVTAGGTDFENAVTVFSVPANTASLSIAFEKPDGGDDGYRIDNISLAASETAGTSVDFSQGVEKDFGSDESGDSPAVPESKGKKTVEEFISAADIQNYYELTGTVSGFKKQYCDFTLTDATGDIYVYSVLDASKAEWAEKISDGGTITIYGKYKYYEQKSQHEVVEAYIVSFTAGDNPGGEEPEPPVTEGTKMTVAEVLASSTAIPEGSYIEAVVISDRNLNNLTSKKGMYVQDETAGLQFYLAENHEFNSGDKVKVDLSGVTLADYNGAVQVSGLALDKIEVISTGNAVEAKTVTLADFLANRYEGQYIAIEGVQVVAADLEKTFVMPGNDGKEAHTSINLETADGKTFAIFSSKYATYGDVKVPQGSGTIKGISSISKGAMQVIFAKESDYAGLTGERFGDNPGGEVTPPEGGDEPGGEVNPPEGGNDEGTKDSPKKATIQEFLAAPVSADFWYELTGEIINIANQDWGNFTIKDATGEVYIYGMTNGWVGSNDKSFSKIGLKVGDTVTLGTLRGAHNDTPQGGGKEVPAFYISHVSGEGGNEGGDNPGGEVTPPEGGDEGGESSVTTVTFDWSKLATITDTEYTGTTVDGITLTGTRIAINKDGSFRIYATSSSASGGSVTFNSGDKKMTKIEFTFTSDNYTGTLEAEGYSNGVWTGESNEVRFVNTGKQARVKKIVITVTE